MHYWFVSVYVCMLYVFNIRVRHDFSLIYLFIYTFMNARICQSLLNVVINKYVLYDSGKHCVAVLNKRVEGFLCTYRNIGH